MTTQAKLTPKEIKYFHDIDQKINELYELKRKAVTKIIEKKGPCSGFIKLEGNNIEKPFLRVTLKDQLEEIKEGLTLYRNTAFSRYHVEVTGLKNEPKP